MLKPEKSLVDELCPRPEEDGRNVRGSVVDRVAKGECVGLKKMSNFEHRSCSKLRGALDV